MATVINYKSNGKPDIPAEAVRIAVGSERSTGMARKVSSMIPVKSSELNAVIQQNGKKARQAATECVPECNPISRTRVNAIRRSQGVGCTPEHSDADCPFACSGRS